MDSLSGVSSVQGWTFYFLKKKIDMERVWISRLLCYNYCGRCGGEAQYDLRSISKLEGFQFWFKPPRQFIKGFP